LLLKLLLITSVLDHENTVRHLVTSKNDAQEKDVMDKLFYDWVQIKIYGRSFLKTAIMLLNKKKINVHFLDFVFYIILNLFCLWQLLECSTEK